MAVPYEQIVAEDMNRGYGQVDVTMPAGGTAVGTKVGIQTWMPRTLNVRDFGAVADGTTDDTAAIQAAIDAAVAIDIAEQAGLDNRLQHGGRTRVHAEGLFRISDTVFIACDFDGSRATFLVAGAPAVAVSASAPVSVSNPEGLVARLHIYFPEVISLAGLAPPNCTGIGVQVVNAQFCRFHMQKIERFGTGIDVTASGDGTAWNTFHMNWIYNNNIGLDVGNGIDGFNSYVNENTFYQGAFSISSGFHLPGTRYIRVGRCNSLTFYSSALEGDGPEYAIECAGRFNLWLMPRFEGTVQTPRVLFTDVVGSAFTSGCDNAIWMGLIAGSGTELQLTNSGTFAARNQVLAWQAGAKGGISHQHCSEYFDSDVSSGTATLYVDAINHRLGVGTTTPSEALGLIGNSNIDFDNFAFVGQTFSFEGLLLGYNAKADTVAGVPDQVVAAQAFTGYRFMRLSSDGLSVHASDTAVAAGDVLSNERLKINGTDIKLSGLPADVAGDRYLVIDAQGRVHKAVSGPNGIITVDENNHRVGINNDTPEDTLSLAGYSIVNFADFAYLGNLYSSDGLVLGYNAKPDTQSGVQDKVIAATTFAGGFRFIRVTAGPGISLHASNNAVTEGDDLTSVGRKLTVDGTGVKIENAAAFTAGSKYLVIDPSGYIRVSALGPAS